MFAAEYFTIARYNVYFRVYLLLIYLNKILVTTCTDNFENIYKFLLSHSLLMCAKETVTHQESKQIQKMDAQTTILKIKVSAIGEV